VPSRGQDMHAISQSGFTDIRTYYPSYYGVELVPIAQAYNISTLLGIYTQDEWTDAYVTAAIAQANSAPNAVLGIVLGNEHADLLSMNWNQWVSVAQRIRAEVKWNIGIGMAQDAGTWMRLHRLPNSFSQMLDFVAVNVYPSIPFKRSSAMISTVSAVKQIVHAFGPIPVVVSEVRVLSCVILAFKVHLVLNVHNFNFFKIIIIIIIIYCYTFRWECQRKVQSNIASHAPWTSSDSFFKNLVLGRA
jgi:hypothetical protein